MLTSRVDGRFSLKLLLAGMLAIIAALAISSSARAGLDTWPVGNNATAVTMSASVKLNYTAPITAAANAGQAQLTVGAVQNGTGTIPATNTRDFRSGRLVMIIQSQGLPAGSALSGAQAPIDITNAQVGQFEIGRMAADISSNTITLEQPLSKGYLSTGAQVVAIPEYGAVTVNTAITIDANVWNGTSGGVTAFLSSGNITLTGTAKISADAQGFRPGARNGGGGTNCTALDGAQGGEKGEGAVYGATYYGTTVRMRGNRANGAGGGDCENGGGGGGGNGGLGGRGGDAWTPDFPVWPVGGRGGQRLIYSPLDHAVFGGGGGGGEQNNGNGGGGARGGGVVFVRAVSLSGTGTISAVGGNGTANVATGASDGAGGAGAGGVVHARFTGAATCGGISAKGGTGGNDQSNGAEHGPGGGGGGGRVLLQSTGGACATNTTAGNSGVTTQSNAGPPVIPAGWQRGAGPEDPNGASYVGASEVPAGGMLTPTATVSTPTASQTVPISPTFTGTSTALSTIRVYIDGTYNSSVISDGSGNWTFNAPALSGGAHTMYVIPVKLDIAGAQTASRSFTVDNTAPVAPVIALPAGVVVTNVAKPTLSGTAEANSSLTFYDGATQIASGVPVTGGGSWSFTLLADLSLGAHSITARATDPYGNTGPASAVKSITFDNVPAVLTISAPAAGAFLSTATPSVAYSSNEGGSATCQVDSGAQPACGSPTSWTTPSLSQGPHTVTVRWTDPAGNVTPTSRSFNVDTVLPTASITAPAVDGTLVNSQRPSIGFSVDDTDSTGTTTGLSECRVVGVSSFSPCDPPYVTPQLTDGTYSVELRHTDKAGKPRKVSRSINVDTTLPTVAISSTAPDAYPLPNPTVSFSVTDANPGTNWCQMDGGAEAPCSSNISGGVWVPALSPGGHTLAIRHRDAATNLGTTSSVNFIVDATAPTVTVSSPIENALVATTSPQIEFALGELNPSATSSCQIDALPATSCTSPHVASGLTQGAHTLTVTHTDKAGNVGTNAPRHFTVDSIPAAPPTFGTKPNNPTNAQNASFTFSLAEGGGTVECQLDTGGWYACAGPQSFPGPLSDGEHSFFVRQNDAAGNLGQIGTHTWVIDRTKPPAPIVSGPSGVSSAPSETFTFYNAEQGVTFTCQLDALPAAACNSGDYTASGLTDSPHTFTVIATDAAGNASDPTTLSWTTNTVDFNVAITTAPAVLSNVRSGTINVSSSVYGATFRCTLTGPGGTIIGPDAPCGPAVPYGVAPNPLPDGAYSFSVYAEQGGDQTAPASRNWTVDATLPSLNVTSPLDSATTGRNVPVNFTASDSGGGVTTTCKLDNAPAVPCVSGHMLTNIAGSPPSHTLLVTTTDDAGNFVQVVRTWNVDTTPPVTTFTQSPASSTKVAAATFAFAANKSPATYECSSDGISWSACTSPRTVTATVQGVQHFLVRATAFGNTEQAPAHHIWTYDTTAPAPPSITSDARVLAGGSITIRGESEADSAVELFVGGNTAGNTLTAPNGNWELELSGLTQGTYTLCARATDAAANTSACSTPAVELVIDTSPPVVAISSPDPITPQLVNSPNITFSGSDTYSAVHFECRIDDHAPGVDPTPYAVCTPPTYVPDLVSGHTYTATVRATDELQHSATATTTFTYDGDAPARPTISSPATDMVTNTQPVIGGAAETGSTVKIIVDGSQVGQTTAPAGTWSYTFAPELAERIAAYAITVTATDAAGNTSLPSLTRSVTIDRTAPPAPVISMPANAKRPPISGTANSSAASVTVREGVTSICTAVVVGSNWSCTPSGDLADGDHNFAATALDAAGNESAASATVSFVVDLTPPTAAIGALTPALSGQYLTSTSVSIAFNASDNDSFTLACTMDGQAAPSGGGACTSAQAFSGLTQGPHTFQVVATDRAGNAATASVAYVVDTIAPQAPTFNSPADGAYMSGDALLASGSSDAGSELELTIGWGVDSASYSVDPDVNGDWSFPFSGLPDRDYTLSLTASDAAGNTSPAATRSFTIDNEAPDALDITSHATGDEVQSVASVSGSGAETGAVVTVNVAGQDRSATVGGGGSWSVTLPAAIETEGALAITARQSDRAGNLSPLATANVMIDRTPPVVGFSAPANGSHVNDATPEVSFSATDANTVASRECRVATAGNPTSFASCTSPWETPALGQGANSIEVRATDKAGNPITAQLSFVVDTIAPATPGVTRNLPTTSPSNSTSAQVAYSGIEAGATAQCKLDSGSWATCASSPVALSGLDHGSHTYYVRQADQAGNVSGDSSATWIVDLQAPAPPTIASPTDGATFTSTNKPTITGSAENSSVVTVRIDGVSIGTVTADPSLGTWSLIPTAAIANGAHTITATARDEAGNVSGPTTPAVAITIDVPAPVTSFTNKPSAFSGAGQPPFDFSSDIAAKFTCTLDGGTPFACGTTASFEFTGSWTSSTALADQSHTLEVFATTTAGFDGGAATWTWTVDRTNPVVTLSAPAAAAVLTTHTPTVAFSVTEANQTVSRCVVDGPTMTTVDPCTSGQSLPALADGAYELTVTHVDKAGNTGSSAVRNFTIDTTGPLGTLAQQAGSGVDGAKPVFLIGANEPATLTCSIDGAPAIACTSPYTPAQTLSPGGHALNVTYTDAVGNTSQKSLSFTQTSAPGPPPSPQPPPAGDPGECLPNGIAITSMTLKGSKVNLSGFARKTFVGQTVSVYYKASAKKPVSTALVQPDGSFAASFKGPAKKLRAAKSSAYQLKVGSVKTSWTQLTRRMAATSASYSGGKLTVTGAVTKPTFPGGKATVYARSGCSGAWPNVGSVTISSSGKFSLSVPFTPSSGVAFIRVQAIVASNPKKPKKLKTNSFVIPVITR